MLLFCLLVAACRGTDEPAPTQMTADTTGTTAIAGTTHAASDTGTASATTTAAVSPADLGSDNDFIVRPDGGMSSECDPYAQTCPPGQKCAWTGSSLSPDYSRCVPLAPEPLPDGAACEYNVETLDGIDACGKWAVCIESAYSGDDYDGVGTCMAMCRGSGEHPYCEGGGVCFGGRTSWWCAPLCDPLVQDCPEGHRCDLVGAAPICEFDSSDAPELPLGAACSEPWLGECEQGSTCFPDATPDCEKYCCTPFCDRDDPDASCPLPGQKCLPPLDDYLRPGAESVGICRMETP